ncbi:hypothetical protein UCDDS831_g02453 [Diplodia seriata]|uniref:Uncharacterized protein n=1 Tax=Diplodia seriata TaxID=420778 RepID=A0A0G2H6W6_9PEZI|nr:hypothetical protein UCDDS831_g02453 [Diplodia seriata]
MSSNISDAATLIAALQAVDAGNTAAVPPWQKLQLTRSDYALASRWLSANAPPATSTRTPRSIARNAPALTLTLRFPPPLHAAVLARLKNAVSTRIAALRNKGPPFAAVANQVLALDHFPLGTAPVGGTTFDPVWQQKLVIPVVEVVQPFKEVEERKMQVVDVDDEWDMADPDTGYDWVSVEDVGEGCISTSDLVGDIFSSPRI